MVKRVFVFPLGFHEDPLLRLLTDFRASISDKVIVFTCRPMHGGVRRAFESLRAFCIKQGFPEPESEVLECSDFYESVKHVRRVLEKLKDAEVIAEVGAGLRILGHVITTTLIFIGKEFTLHYEPEGGVGEPITIPKEFFSLVIKEPTDFEKKVLNEVIKDPGVTIKELSSKLNRSEKTIRNTVSKLRGRGLIEKKARSEKLEATKLAKALYE
ncbi:MAG: CRISPR-associated CARF protein Csa3 [Sulfolobales archaeon]|nr:CRISPR-associated CARF protein Csa3 [Sulfolobales archaeon]